MNISTSTYNNETRNSKLATGRLKGVLMQNQELNTLLELKENPNLSQRSLSHKLNISLGLTNAIIKNLIHRGWIRVKKILEESSSTLLTLKVWPMSAD